LNNNTSMLNLFSEIHFRVVSKNKSLETQCSPYTIPFEEAQLILHHICMLHLVHDFFHIWHLPLAFDLLEDVPSNIWSYWYRLKVWIHFYKMYKFQDFILFSLQEKQIFLSKHPEGMLMSSLNTIFLKLDFCFFDQSVLDHQICDKCTSLSYHRIMNRTAYLVIPFAYIIRPLGHIWV